MVNHKEIDKICNSANNNFKVAFKKHNKKFDYGHKWLKFKSDIFLNESNKKFMKRYPRYKRGTILYVDFGVNIGGEFCGRHFAISLVKDDNSFKSTTTVIPLTSKGGKGKIRLGKALINPYTNKLVENTDSLLVSVNKIIEQRNEIVSLIPVFENALLELKSPDHANNLPVNKLIPILENAGLKLNKDIEYTKESLQKEFDKYANKLYLKPIKLSQKMEILKNELKQLDLINQQAKKLNVDSFALSDHIYTISKLKIIKRNRHDPTGEITIDDNLLKLLSDNLARKFTLA